MAHRLPGSNGFLAIGLFGVVLLSGCTSIDYRAGPVLGLDRMSVEEHFIDAGTLYAACARCGHGGPDIALACTCIDFRTNHAVIWLARGAPQWMIEHERAHGLGYDHPDGELHRRYAAWKSSLARSAARSGEPSHEARAPRGTSLTALRNPGN